MDNLNNSRLQRLGNNITPPSPPLQAPPPPPLPPPPKRFSFHSLKLFSPSKIDMLHAVMDGMLVTQRHKNTHRNNRINALVCRRLLMKALLRAISLGTYALGNNTSRIYGSEESFLPQCLYIIFRRARHLGGGVFSLAATTMSDLIHKDPTCFPLLEAAGRPSAFFFFLRINTINRTTARTK